MKECIFNLVASVQKLSSLKFKYLAIGIRNGACLFLFNSARYFAKFNFSYFVQRKAAQFTAYMPNSFHCPCYQCPDCPRTLKSSRGLAQHRNSSHRAMTPPFDDGEEDEDENIYTYRSHPFLNGKHC